MKIGRSLLAVAAVLGAATAAGDSGQSSGWKADVPESHWHYIVLHHSATESGSVETIDAEHRRRMDSNGNPWLGIGYHFVIGNGTGAADGQINSTFRWKEQISGAHSGNAEFNTRGIGVCLIGNFEKGPPSGPQLAAVKKLVAELSLRHRIPGSRITGHSSIRSTSCPGRHFPLAEVQRAAVSATQG